MNTRARTAMQRGARWALAGLLWVGAGAARAQGLAPAAPAPDPLQRELDFCQGLVRLRFADYATRIMDNLEREQPAAKARIARVRVTALTALGKADDARALIKSFPQDRIDTMAMLLALGDQLYAMNRLAEARTIYREFFSRYPKGPPAELAEFFRESAYKYAQMMILTGNDKDALAAYELVLLTKPEPDIERRMQIEVAELCFKLGKAASGRERDAYFARTKDLCQKVQWRGRDLWFGQSVVLLAHLELVQGKPAQARDTIQMYLPMLRELDDALKEEGYPMKLSPMAQCRYILGTIYEDEARALFAADKRDESLKSFTQALTHLFNVFVKYPDSTWAPDAGARSERMAEDLRAAGFQVKLPEINLAPVIEAQLREARMMFAQNDFKSAAAKYLMVLNVFPEKPGSAQSLGELAQCYLNLQDKLYLQVAVQELTDRYGMRPRSREEAGTAVMRTAAAAEDIQDAESATWLNRVYFERFPDHPQAAAMLYRAGDAQFTRENYDLAIGYFGQIAESHSNAPAYLPALNRLAMCYAKQADWTNAAAVLERYVDELSLGAPLAAARFRLAEAYRNQERLVPAINEYFRLIKALVEEPEKYGSNPDERQSNRAILEQAMFWKAYSYSRLREPADKTAAHQAKAAEDYAAFLKAFPKSALAPNALSSMGVLLLVLNRGQEASAAYEQLAREYPDSEQARNAVFARGTSLLEMGEREKAVKVFEEMFARPASFAPLQFYQAGRVMLDQQEVDVAIRAFRQAMQQAGADAGLKETLHYSLGEALAKKGDNAGVVRELEAMMELNPNTGFTLPAGFLLSRAYAELGKAAADEPTRGQHFNAAVRAMNRASRVMRQPEERAQRDLELAAIQILRGETDGALASYQRLILLSDYNNPKVRPVIEQAFELVMPLLEARGLLQDIADNAALYLEQYPRGRLADRARQWRADAQRRMAMAGALGGTGAPAPEAP